MAIRVEQKLNGIPIAEDTDVRILHTKSKNGPYDHFYVGKKIAVRAYLA
jgi:hypothetical protein